MGLCLVVDEMHPSLQPLLQSIGVAMDYQPNLTAAEVAAALAAQPYEGLVVRSKLRVTADLLAHGPHLRYVARAGAGTDNIDEAAMAAAGVTLLNAPEGNRDAVGEFAVGLLLGLLRNIARADHEVRDGQWRREANRGTEIGGKTIGLLGYGHTGRAFARRLGAFGCTVLAHDSDPATTTDGHATLGLVIAIAMQFNILIAGLAGVMVPLTLDRLEADPAVASSVFVTMITDSMGFLAFLGLATAAGLTG